MKVEHRVCNNVPQQKNPKTNRKQQSGNSWIQNVSHTLLWNPDIIEIDGGFSHLGIEAAQWLDQVGGPAHVKDGRGAALLPLADAVVEAEQVGKTFRVLKCGERCGLLRELLQTTRTRLIRKFIWWSSRLPPEATHSATVWCSPLNSSCGVSVPGMCIFGPWSVRYASRYTTNDRIHLRHDTIYTFVIRYKSATSAMWCHSAQFDPMCYDAIQ